MTFKTLWAFVAIATSTFASQAGLARITQPTYFPPNPKIGNAINLQYEDTNPATGTYFKEISTSYQFDTLAPSPTGTWYIATDFWIQSAPGVGDYMYMGVNLPNKDRSYGGQVHFSYFGALGGAVDTPNTCHGGADSGQGITCAVDIPTRQGDQVRLVATLLETNATAAHVKGTVFYFDSATRKVTAKVIGAFWVKRGNTALAYPGGWIEGTSDPNYCADLVKTSLTYSPVSVVDVSGNAREIQIDTLRSAYCGAMARPTLKPGYIQITYPQMTPPGDQEGASVPHVSTQQGETAAVNPERPDDNVKSKAGR